MVRVKVTHGSYKLTVSGRKYLPYGDVIDASADVNLRVDMLLEPKRDSYLD